MNVSRTAEATPSHSSRPITRIVRGLLAQAASSGSNFLVSFVAVHLLSVSEFGVFALAQLLVVVGVGLLRSMVGEGLLVLNADERRAGPGLALTLSAALGAACAVGLFVNSVPLWLVIGVPVGLTIISVQDAHRMASFGGLDATRPLLSDGLWLGVQAIGLLVAREVGLASAEGLFAIWIGSALVGLLYYLATASNGIRIRSSLALGSKHWRMGLGYSGEFVAGAGVSYGLVFFMAYLHGATYGGTIRATQQVFLPIAVTFQGISALAIPRFRQVKSRAKLRTASLWISILTTTISLVWVTIFVAVDGARRLVLPYEVPSMVTVGVIAAILLNSTFTGPYLALRGRGRSKLALQSRLIAGTVQVLSAVSLAVASPGFLPLALAVGPCVDSILRWRHLYRETDASSPKVPETL